VLVFYPEFDREQLIKIISGKLEELEKRLPLILVVLFGSYAKGNYTVRSDVDLLIVYSGRRREDAFAMVKKIFNIPRLEPHFYTEEDYRKMEKTLSKMIKDGIVLLSRT